jgi:UDP-N-acetylglucosamine--N-acetylmuramyl-(pentapeptide) pyrophosphoryl-undecaprenol N-acetylglucosamine transferase
LPGALACGNPVRRDLAELPPPAQRYAGREGPLRLLVVGGSLGAQVLNETVPAALAAMPAGVRPQVVHQTGRGRRDEVLQRYRQAGVEAQVTEFIDDMAAAYADADLLVCRAGAMTVSEIAAAGVASILVPFPHAVDDHQTGNARHLSEHGAARLLPQRELDAARLAALLAGLTRADCAAMATAARALARPDAAARVADVCEEAALPT